MVTRNSETHHNSSICTKNKENFQQQSLEINGSREACLEPKLSKDCASPRNILHGERLEAKLCRYSMQNWPILFKTPFLCMRFSYVCSYFPLEAICNLEKSFKKVSIA